MKYFGLIIICASFINSFSIYAKGSVEIGVDSIAIRYDANPVGNPSDYTIRTKSIYRYNRNRTIMRGTGISPNTGSSTNALRFVTSQFNSTLTLTQLSTLSNSSFITLSSLSSKISLNGLSQSNIGINSLSTLKLTNDSSSGTVKYIEPIDNGDDDDNGVLVDAVIEVWGKDQITGTQLICSIAASQSIISYISVKVAIDLFGQGRLVVTYVDTLNGQCGGAYII